MTLLVGSLRGPQGYPGRDGERGAPGNPGLPGQPGRDGERGQDGAPGIGFTLREAVTNVSNLPAVGDPGEARLVTSTGNLHVWDGTDWINAGPIQGPRGYPGQNGQDGAPGLNGQPGRDGERGTGWHVSDQEPPVLANIPGAKTGDLVLTPSGNVWRL